MKQDISFVLQSEMMDALGHKSLVKLVTVDIVRYDFDSNQGAYVASQTQSCSCFVTV